MGKILIIIGLVLLFAGVIFHFFDRIPFFGKLPGDLVIDRPNFKLYFPLMSGIILSLLLSLIIFLLNKFKN
jgi:hypothetical protein